MSTQPDQRWSLTRDALALLLRQLDEEPEAAALGYETVRRRLVAFFEIRGLLSSEALADETLDRVARRLEEGETVGRLSAYVYGVAERLSREAVRRQARQQAAAIEMRRTLPATAPDPEEAEPRLTCLKSCLRKLPGESRALILGYYEGEGLSHLEGRKLLADRLGISYGNLKTRAHRIRGQLEQCLRRCLETREAGNR